jgi:hypothetical protein
MTKEGQAHHASKNMLNQFTQLVKMMQKAGLTMKTLWLVQWHDFDTVIHVAFTGEAAGLEYNS